MTREQKAAEHRAKFAPLAKAVDWLRSRYPGAEKDVHVKAAMNDKGDTVGKVPAHWGKA